MKPTADRCQIQVCPPGMVSWMVGRPGGGGVGGAVEGWMCVCVCRGGGSTGYVGRKGLLSASWTS